MNKEYKKINFQWGCGIEEAVKELLKYKENGELVCGDFNGHTLYSDTVTVDRAYIEILGTTKAEYKKAAQTIIIPDSVRLFTERRRPLKLNKNIGE